MYKRDTCIPMFIVAIFIITKLWNQLKCPITDGWIKKKYTYTHTHTHTHTHIPAMEYYSTIKENEMMSLAGNRSSF
jgi:hypothetical protein